MKQSIILNPTLAVLFLERLAQQVRDNRLSLQVIQGESNGITIYNPYVYLGAGLSLDDEFFIALVETLLLELRAGGEE